MFLDGLSRRFLCPLTQYPLLTDNFTDTVLETIRNLLSVNAYPVINCTYYASAKKCHNPYPASCSNPSRIPPNLCVIYHSFF